MKWGPLFVVLGVAAAVPAAASCTHTVDGTGPAIPAADTTSGTPPPDAPCQNIGGQWNFTGTCGSDQCNIIQTDCDLNFDCKLNVFNGTITGRSIQWEAPNGSCTGNLGPEGVRITGTCGGGACNFAATK